MRAQTLPWFRGGAVWRLSWLGNGLYSGIQGSVKYADKLGWAGSQCEPLCRIGTAAPALLRQVKSRFGRPIE